MDYFFHSTFHFAVSEVVIGFEMTMYITNESSSQVVVAILVREGQLGRSVVLRLTTMDGSALSKSGFKFESFETII